MVMIPFGLHKDFSYTYFIASGAAVVLLPALCVMYGVMGAVAAVLVIETVVTASMLTFIYIRLPWFRPFRQGRPHA
jgi:O-antigen/teichoic acid export membrane protein